jgi:hypothetical protein
VEPPHPTRLATAGYLTTTVLLLLTILWAAAVIGSAVAGAASGNYTPSLEITTWPGQLAEPLPPGFDLVEHVPIQVTFHQPTLAQLLLSVAVGLLPLLLVAAVLWLLRGLARSVRHGDPFGAANVRRLRRLGLLFLLGYPVMVIVTRLLQDWLGLHPAGTATWRDRDHARCDLPHRAARRACDVPTRRGVRPRPAPPRRC